MGEHLSSARCVSTGVGLLHCCEAAGTMDSRQIWTVYSEGVCPWRRRKYANHFS